MGNCKRGNCGHAKGHVPAAFLDATLAYMDWEAADPEPMVDSEGRPIPFSRACGIVWNCSDILPSGAVDTLDGCGIDLSRRTYAAASRALSAVSKKLMTAPADKLLVTLKLALAAINDAEQSVTTAKAELVSRGRPITRSTPRIA